MTAAVHRMREYRERRKLGRVVFSVEVSEVDLIEELKASGDLDPADEDDHDAVSRALQRAVEFLIFGKREKENETST